MNNFSNEAYYMLFSTLSNRIRLAIIDVLKDDPKSISEISAALNQEQTTVSANLKELEKCVLVISKSEGKERLYSLNKEIVEPLANILEFHTAKHCPGQRECIPQEKLKEYMKKKQQKRCL